MLWAYNTLALPLRALPPLLEVAAGKSPEAVREWEERRARRLPDMPPGGIWIHGASVGEARIVRLLAAALRAERPGVPLAASAVTRSGRGQLPSPPMVEAAFYAPLDFAGLPGRVLDGIRPRVLVLVETEIWPNLLHEAFGRGVPVAVINGRLAPERMARYRRFRRLFSPLLAGLAKVAALSPDEAERFVELGVRREALTVTGNVKYDLPVPAASEASLRLRFGIAEGRPVVLAGSTGPGEESMVLDAFAEARAEHPSLYLVLAPRHPERAGEVASEMVDRGLSHHRLTAGADVEAGRADVLLVDRVGELASLYAMATAAFVGGTLVPIGGHNVLEPAAAGAPVLVGPHTSHVTETVEALLGAGGAIRVLSPAALAEAWKLLVRDGEERRRIARAAGGVVRTNRGALERTVAVVLSLLDRS
ncbi:MAG: 3-deoxy-D-manno-octulosonic acid transferase [Acidobacteriia bacterium]|nr:3-deoxy-D-manno-octulosonic acid transferase [Terriglobia bacterium]